MKGLQRYACLRRYIGICGEECIEDARNLLCPNYYPCLVTAGGAIVESPAQARDLQGRLIELAERQSAKPDVSDVAAHN